MHDFHVDQNGVLHYIGKSSGKRREVNALTIFRDPVVDPRTGEVVTDSIDIVPMYMNPKSKVEGEGEE